jgi:hypothetical protein
VPHELVTVPSYNGPDVKLLTFHAQFGGAGIIVVSINSPIESSVVLLTIYVSPKSSPVLQSATSLTS